MTPQRRRSPMADARIAEMNYYEWSVSRWLGSKARMMLDGIGRGIYREMLDLCYQQGGIPKDHTILARLCAVTPEQFEQNWPVIKNYFKPHPSKPDELHNIEATMKRKAYFDSLDSKRKGGITTQELFRQRKAAESDSSAAGADDQLQQDDSFTSRSAAITAAANVMERESKGKEKGTRKQSGAAVPPLEDFDPVAGCEALTKRYPVQRGIDAGAQFYLGDMHRAAEGKVTINASPVTPRQLHALIMRGIDQHCASVDWRDKETGELDTTYIPALDVFLGGRPRNGARIPSRMYLDSPPAWKPKQQRTNNSASRIEGLMNA